MKRQNLPFASLVLLKCVEVTFQSPCKASAEFCAAKCPLALAFLADVEMPESLEREFAIEIMNDEATQMRTLYDVVRVFLSKTGSEQVGVGVGDSAPDNDMS